MAEQSKTYSGVFYRQRKSSPLLFSFVASSADIHDWGSAPVKTAGNIRNFQRPEIESHVNEIGQFFKRYPENCSPSSIVVGFLQKPKIMDLAGNVIDPAVVTPGKTTPGKIEIFYIEPALDVGKQRADLPMLISSEILRQSQEIERIEKDTSRINSNGEGEVDGSIPIPEDATADTGGVDDVEDAELDGGQDSEGDALEIIDGDESQELADRKKIRAELLNIKINDLSDPEVSDQYDILLSLKKPGLIIDGQHRVRGTRGDEVLFSVTALPDADWSELAFQFIVLNKSAKKVSDSLLINIVGYSLSPKELSGIEKRLNDSGIAVLLYQGVMRLHDDPQSPFYQRLKFGIDNETGIIDAKAAKTKIVAYWYKCGMYDLVKHLIPGTGKKEKLRKWQATGLWYEFMKEFWCSARQHYESNSSLWSDQLEPDGKTPTSKLMRATIINLTQRAIVEHMFESLEYQKKNDLEGKKTIASLLPDIKTFRKYSDLYIKRLQAEFFTEWGAKAKGLDGSSAVKDAFVAAVKLVVSGNATISQLKNNSGIVKGHQSNPHIIFQK